MHMIIHGPAGNVWTAQGAGMALTALGTFALFGAVLAHRRELRRLRRLGWKPRFSLTMAVGTALAILGVMALLALAEGA
jgi:hypothetical protein